MSDTLLISQWRRVAADLGLDVRFRHGIPLRNGKILTVDILIENFSNPRGIILHENKHEIGPYLNELNQLGYGYSLFLPPTADTPYNLDIKINMLSEWGWTGDPDKRPTWLKELEFDE